MTMNTQPDSRKGMYRSPAGTRSPSSFPHTFFRAWTLGLLFLALLSSVSATASGAETPSAGQVKAAMVYSIAKFVDWPADTFADANAPFTICVMGKGLLVTGIESLKGQNVKNRKVLIRQVTKTEEAEGCQILLIGDSARRQAPEMLNRLGKQSTMTISDLPNFAENGGVVGFVEDEGKVRFEINLGAAQHSRIHISAQLLRLAKKILGVDR